jgi:hypothetical protein
MQLATHLQQLAEHRDSPVLALLLKPLLAEAAELAQHAILLHLHTQDTTAPCTNSALMGCCKVHLAGFFLLPAFSSLLFLSLSRCRKASASECLPTPNPSSAPQLVIMIVQDSTPADGMEWLPTLGAAVCALMHRRSEAPEVIAMATMAVAYLYRKWALEASQDPCPCIARDLARLLFPQCVVPRRNRVTALAHQLGPTTFYRDDGPGDLVPRPSWLILPAEDGVGAEAQLARLRACLAATPDPAELFRADPTSVEGVQPATSVMESLLLPQLQKLLLRSPLPKERIPTLQCLTQCGLALARHMEQLQG